MTTGVCPKCGHDASKNEELIVEGKLASLGGIALGSLINHRLEIVVCTKCNYIRELYYRGRVF
ncbi:MAG: hypothetical protein HY686_01400 [Chloroflexi bacterium]|nr:hypothetical protein [Chloroflexota bacterium]